MYMANTSITIIHKKLMYYHENGMYYSSATKVTVDSSV